MDGRKSLIIGRKGSGKSAICRRLITVWRLQSASLKLKAFGVVEASVDFNSASEGARAARQLEVLERGVAAAFADLGCVHTHKPLLFLVDQLEQAWTIDPDSHAMITGLLLATKHVTGEYGKAARCALFLRSDIYDTLNFSDGDKFHSDEVRITWTRAGLRDLALARARASLDRPLTHQQLWGEVFPGTIEDEPTADYLFSRALPRPRDAIQFLTVCRDTADKNGHRTVHEEDVVQATLQFSQWKLQDLAKEYLVNYPFLKVLFTLFENTGYVVMRQALEMRFAARRETLHKEFPAYAESLTLQGVIDVLFGVSFLGVKRGNDVVYAGGTQAPVQPNETVGGAVGGGGGSESGGSGS